MSDVRAQSISEAQDRVLALKMAFDRGFALPAATRAEAVVQILAFRSGGAPYVVKARSMQGIAEIRTLTALPTKRDGLLGIASLRRGTVAVFSLSALLGGGSVPSQASNRWMLLTRGIEPVGLAVDSLDGLFSLPLSGLVPVVAREASASVIAEAVELNGEMRPVVDLGRVVAALKIDIEANRAGGSVES